MKSFAPAVTKTIASEAECVRALLGVMALTRSILKFVISGVVLAAVLWLGAKFAAAQFGAMAGLRDEAALLLLVAVGAVVYGGSILALFGPRWLRSLV